MLHFSLFSFICLLKKQLIENKNLKKRSFCLKDLCIHMLKTSVFVMWHYVSEQLRKVNLLIIDTQSDSAVNIIILE